MSHSVALITGPTSGLGKEFALQYAAQGYDLVLVARDEFRLRELASGLHDRHGIRAEVLVADLADEAAQDLVADRLADGVQALVNNAGFGTSLDFWKEDSGSLRTQLDVNVSAPLVLTRAALPPMLAAGRGTVINVASLAGLMPGRAATYTASKAWVVYFSEGLAGGLAGTGVGVHVLCPGFVPTEFHQRAGLNPTVPSFMWISAESVVRSCLADVARGKVIIVPGFQNKLMVAGARMLPRKLARTMAERTASSSGLGV